MIINLPWFNPVLNPNKRTHWSVKAKARSKQRFDAKLLTMGKKLPKQSNYPLNITFFPPDNRARDRDNCLSSIKGGIDGVADGLGVNDKLFYPITIDFGAMEKGGRIQISILKFP